MTLNIFQIFISSKLSVATTPYFGRNTIPIPKNFFPVFSPPPKALVQLSPPPYPKNLPNSTTILKKSHKTFSRSIHKKIFTHPTKNLQPHRKKAPKHSPTLSPKNLSPSKKSPPPRRRRGGGRCKYCYLHPCI